MRDCNPRTGNWVKTRKTSLSHSTDLLSFTWSGRIVGWPLVWSAEPVSTSLLCSPYFLYSHFSRLSCLCTRSLKRSVTNSTIPANHICSVSIKMITLNTKKSKCMKNIHFVNYEWDFSSVCVNLLVTQYPINIIHTDTATYRLRPLRTTQARQATRARLPSFSLFVCLSVSPPSLSLLL